MARPRHQPPPEPPERPEARRSSLAAEDADGITWPTPYAGWHDADGVWHAGDPRRLLEQEWTVPPATSLDNADAQDRKRRRQQVERQAATEQARRTARHHDIPGRPIRPRRGGTSEERDR